MRIEYVLTESNHDKPDKRRIKNLIKKEFPDLDSSNIPVQPSRKVFNLEYSIGTEKTTESDNKDIVYHITVSSDHPEKSRQAELLEFFHKKYEVVFSQRKEYHLIVAYDGVSEYYCNKVYPKFQHFERQLRHLIFKVVTRAYGSVWAKETLEKDTKDKLKNNIKSIKGIKKEDLLIEQALYEMTLGQLIDYLFYGEERKAFFEELDDKYPHKCLKSMSKEEIIEVIEQARRKSIWNNFLAKEIKIEFPVTKLKYIKQKRNNVAHCKFFYIDDYKIASEYLDEFSPEIDQAIENATIIDALTLSDIAYGFVRFISEMAQGAVRALSPAINALADIVNYVNSEIQQTSFSKLGEALAELSSVAVLPNISDDNSNDDEINIESKNISSEEDTETNESENKSTDEESDDINTEQKDDID